MQFLVVGHDGDDPSAPERRLAARPAHLALGDRLRDEGRLLYAAALLDGKDAMVGSVLICEFADRAELDAWLGAEPYVAGGVWKRIEVTPCRVAPSFASRLRPFSGPALRRRQTQRRKR
ncbi:MAG: hypothetical protein HY554_15505 [Elusimicrobia bacterium]|nr:hypothetical protein [Elusimicrobiota bacterium]